MSEISMRRAIVGTLLRAGRPMSITELNAAVLVSRSAADAARRGATSTGRPPGINGTGETKIGPDTSREDSGCTRALSTVARVRTTIGRLRMAVAMVLAVFVAGTIGYSLFGLSLVDAMYMTITTITTVGYRELNGPDLSTSEKVFTMAIIVTGVSTVLYTFTLSVQVIVEGQLSEFVGRRRMDRKIAECATT